MQVARAILFDIRSIQQYIFSDNRLKTNIGASYIVSHVFKDVLLGEILIPGKYGIKAIDADSWEHNTEDPSMLEEGCCYVAYNGGGNILILFSEKGGDYRKEIVGAFTESLLVKYPGLKTGVALGILPLAKDDPDGVKKKALAKLYSELKNNQFTIFPQVNVANTGLTHTCEVNGESANAFVTDGYLIRKGKSRFFSQEVRAKAEAAEKARENILDEFKDALKGYVFPEMVERLGQNEAENSIAVVHVDGNNMGVRFQNCDTLADRGLLSKQVSDKTKQAFEQLLKEIVANYSIYQKFLDFQSENDLPIRPLILGGDDITFVCNARLALLYTKKFMELMADESIGGITINSCAGIAIVPTAYPFFRAYKLAEQLCDVAKKSARKLKTQIQQDSSWLDFAILHGEQAPTIEQIREQEYCGALGDMHFGPYRVDGNPDYHFHIDKLLKAAEDLKKLPRNKYKEMRNVLQHDLHDIKRYMEQLKHDKLKLPVIPGWDNYEKNLWDINKKRTPFVDAIEIIDYIPPKEM